MSDSYEDAGHLSPETAETEKLLREKFAETIAVVDRANRVGMLMLRTMPQEISPEWNGDRLFLATAFLCMVLRRCQAATLLALKGLAPEADTLTRSALEAAILLGSFLVDPKRLLNDLQRDNAQSKRVMAQGMIAENSTSAFLSEENLANLNELVAAFKTLHGGKINVEAHARFAGMSRLYAEIYRGISTSASHVTATSLDRHITVTEMYRSVEFGPEDDEIGIRLVHVLSVLINALRLLVQKFEMVRLRDVIDEVSAKFIALDGKA